jgi:hypothetical protein
VKCVGFSFKVLEVVGKKDKKERSSKFPFQISNLRNSEKSQLSRNMTTSTQYAWEYVTSYLKGDIELAPGFEANLNILVNQHELSDILLQYFFKAANTNFMSISEQFQTIVHKMRADPHIIVPEAIQFANFHWVRWRNIGLQLSSCISRANNLTKAKDYTTEQLLASFNVALFETEDSAVVSSRRDRAAWRNKLNRPNR